LENRRAGVFGPNTRRPKRKEGKKESHSKAGPRGEGRCGPLSSTVLKTSRRRATLRSNHQQGGPKSEGNHNGEDPRKKQALGPKRFLMINGADVLAKLFPLVGTCITVARSEGERRGGAGPLKPRIRLKRTPSCVCSKRWRMRERVIENRSKKKYLPEEGELAGVRESGRSISMIGGRGTPGQRKRNLREGSNLPLGKQEAQEKKILVSCNRGTNQSKGGNALPMPSDYAADDRLKGASSYPEGCRTRRGKDRTGRGGERLEKKKETGRDYCDMILWFSPPKRAE